MGKSILNVSGNTLNVLLFKQTALYCLATHIFPKEG